VAIFRRNSNEAPVPVPPPPPPLVTSPAGRAKKDRPTPSRREAEAARRQRVTRTLTKREARAEGSREARGQRLRSIAVRESVPEKALMRDYVDARFSMGELLLPFLIVVFALTFLLQHSAVGTNVAAFLMYAFILLVLFDSYIIWRGFRKVLAQRLPTASRRGLFLYGFNRSIQFRRFRMPAPRIKRGETY